MNSNLDYFKILNALGDGVLCVNSDKQIMYCNKKASEILEMPCEDVILKPIEDMLKIYVGNHIEIIGELINAVLNKRENMGLFKDSYILNKSNKKKYLSASISYVLNDNSEEFIVINFREITRVKLLEAQVLDQRNNLQIILDSIPMGVLILREDFSVKSINNFVRNRFFKDGTLGFDDLVGNLLKCKYVKNHLCGLSDACKNCTIRNSINIMQNDDQKIKVVRKEYEHFIENKPLLIDYEFTFVRIQEDETLMILQDITHIIEYEKNIEIARIRAEDANQLKSQFLANMSHEIRTPLNGIIGMIDLTVRKLDDPELKENLEIAKLSSEGLLSLINNILDLSKLEAGKSELNIKPFAIMTLLNEVINEHGLSARAKDIGLLLVTNVESETVYSDKFRIKQVLTNLLSNSIKFTDSGSVKLICQLNDNALNIEVVDTGCGIPELFQKVIFNRFTQVDGTFTRQNGGAGLGLAITKEIIEVFEGNIYFNSQVDIGTHFYIKIPLSQSGDDRTNDDMRSQIQKKINLKGNILIVEDDIINQMVIRKQLEMNGYQVKVSSNGGEGISMFNKEQFDLIIMDIKMPVMNGLEAINIIREKDNEIPVIALTALALKSEKKEIMTYGFDRYISKPVDLSELTILVNNILRNKKLLDKNKSRSYNQIDEKKLISDILFFITQENDTAIEVKLHELMHYYETVEKSDNKDIAFKTLILIRKEKYEDATVWMKKLE